ncbi:MAG: hypothetical protein JXL84_06670 [Deltaproteobacteria bacterium]|nr:hypothetical protein [Deltaproteobacteria bacterium]
MPLSIREKLGLTPSTEVDFIEIRTPFFGRG